MVTEQRPPNMASTFEISGKIMAKKQVKVKNTEVHTTFLLLVKPLSILLFVGEGFSFEEDVEHLVSEWVIVHRYSHE